MEKIFFIKENIYSELRKGSVESFQDNIKDLIAKESENIFGRSDLNTHVIATFKEHAIVSDDDCNIFRVHFESKEGDLKLKESEKVDNFKKLTSEDIDKEMVSGLKSSLMQSISEGKSDNLKESVNKYFDFKNHGVANGYIKFKN